MKNVVVVDNDAMMLHTFVGLLKSHGGPLRILPAASAKAALDILARESVDLILTGLHMSEKDTAALLSQVIDRAPRLRVIVMTNNAPPAYRDKLRQMQRVIHFDQPLDMGLLAKRIYTELQIDFGGQIRGISLSAFLQMMELEGRSCTLQIKTKGKSGVIYLVDGKPTAAKMGLLKGKTAALHILTWQNVLIDIDYAPTDIVTEMNTPLMNMLLESGRMVDEKLSQRTNLRKHARYDCLAGVDYHISDWIYQSDMRDISEGGIYIETEQSVNVGQRLLISLSSPVLEQSCSVTGTVVRRDPAGIGVRFDRLTAQQRRTLNALMESCCSPIVPPS